MHSTPFEFTAWDGGYAWRGSIHHNGDWSGDVEIWWWRDNGPSQSIARAYGADVRAQDLLSGSVGPVAVSDNSGSGAIAGARIPAEALAAATAAAVDAWWRARVVGFAEQLRAGD